MAEARALAEGAVGLADLLGLAPILGGGEEPTWFAEDSPMLEYELDYED